MLIVDICMRLKIKIIIIIKWSRSHDQDGRHANIW